MFRLCLILVKQVMENADLFEIKDAGFTRKEMKPHHDPFFEGEFSVDRFAECWGDRFTVRQPPREEEYELPFKFPDDRLVHSL